MFLYLTAIYWFILEERCVCFIAQNNTILITLLGIFWIGKILAILMNNGS